MRSNNGASPPGERSEQNLLGMSVGIKRSGSSVQISLECGADYQAIEVYDRVLEGMQRGEVLIDLRAK
jgi:hypothetical protein